MKWEERQYGVDQSFWISETEQSQYLKERPPRKSTEKGNGDPFLLLTCLESVLLGSLLVVI